MFLRNIKGIIIGQNWLRVPSASPENVRELSIKDESFQLGSRLVSHRYHVVGDAFVFSLVSLHIFY